MFQKKLFIVLMLLLVAAIACQSTAPSQPTNTPTVDSGVQLTAQAQDAASTQQAADQQATEAVVKTADAQTTQTAQAQLDAQSTEAAKKTQSAEATATKKAKNADATATQKAAEIATSTAQVAPMMALLQQFQADKIVDDITGIFKALDPISVELAQMGYGQYHRTGLSPENFVFSAHMQLTSASETANWAQSTCGVIFGEQDNKNYNLVDIALDGYAYSWDMRGGDFRGIAAKSYGKATTPSNEMDFALIVVDQRYVLYVNGKQVFSATNLRLKPGNLAILVRSGTNKGFGTRCDLTNVGVWLFK